MFKKIKSVIKTQMTQGLTARGLAMSIAFAIVLGTIPIFGITTFLCFTFAIWFRLNQPIVQAVNYLLTPVHLLLMPVFLKVGETIMSVEPVPLNPKLLYSEFTQYFSAAFVKYSFAAIYAVLAWLLIMPLVGFLIYLIAKYFFNKRTVSS